MKKRSLKILLICTAMAFVFAGCEENTDRKKAAEVDKKQEAAPEVTQTPTPEPTPEQEEYKLIGTHEMADYEIKVTNRTSHEIKSVVVAERDTEWNTGNLLADGDVYAAAETRILCFKPDERADAPAERKFNVALTFEDDSVHTLHEFPFDKISECDIMFEDDVIFLAYEDVVTGAPVTTKALEIAAMEPEVTPTPTEEPTPTPEPTREPSRPTPTTAPRTPARTPTRTPVRPATPTTAPATPTTAPSEPTTAPSEPTTAPSEPTTAPSEPTTAPSEPTTAPVDPQPVDPQPVDPQPVDPQPVNPDPVVPVTPDDQGGDIIF